MITAAAIIHEGHILIGKHHCDCNRVAAILVRNGIGKFPVGGVSGFWTDDNRFLNRKDAAIHAIGCSQIEKLKYFKGELDSWDIFP